MNSDRAITTKWLGGISALVGVWLIISPFVLGISSAVGMWSTIVVGAIALILGVYQAAAPEQPWPSWVNLLAGIWLIVFPYVLGPPEVAAYNNAVWSGIILGLLALGDALASASLANDQAVHHPM